MTILKFIPKKLFLLFLGDVFIITSSYSLFSFFWITVSERNLYVSAWPQSLFTVTYIFIYYVSDFYNTEPKFKGIRYLFRHISGVVIATGLLAIIFFFVPDLRFSRGHFLVSSVLAGSVTYFWRLIFDLLFKDGTGRRQRLLIVGAGRAGRLLYKTIKDSADFNVLGFMIDDDPQKWKPTHLPAVIGDSSRLRKIIKKNSVDVLVLAITNFKEQHLLKSVLNCKLEGVMVYDMPSFYEKVTGKVPVEHVTDYWLVFTPLQGVKRSVYNLKLKRILDIMLSFLGLVLTLPVTLIAAAAIKLDSKGPVLYKQNRIGLNGDIFSLVKFRSMINGRDHDRRLAGKRNDPRITRAGKFIRLSRIDEIPQMWNVLKGDMSFIGPRALISEEVVEFESKIPYFSLRHAVLPGITGWAQVNYKHGATVEDGMEKLQYDLFYIKNLSPLLDFHILLKTVKVVLFRRGAR